MSEFEAIMMMFLIVFFTVACYIAGKGDLITVCILMLQDKAKQLQKAQEQDAYWLIKVDETDAEIKCSSCGYSYIEADPNVTDFYIYCPNCGKEMRNANNA